MHAHHGAARATPLRPDFVRTARAAAAIAACAALAACGGGSGIDPEEDETAIVADMPARELAPDSAIVADPALGRLVHGSFAADSQDALALISRYFGSRTALTGADMLQAGDVLLIDGRHVTPADLGDADRLAAKAFAAQVPIIIVGLDDALEEAVHRLLPTASLPGFNSLAVVMPARPGMDWSDGAILLSPSQADPSIAITRTVTDQMAAQLRQFQARRTEPRAQSAPVALAAQAGDAGNSQCTASNPSYCNYVKQVPQGRLSISDSSPSQCLSRDWVPYASAVNFFWSRTYVGYDANAPIKYFAPQCPSQVWNFYPVLYLTYATDPATGKLTEPSRVLYLGMGASFDPKVADRNAGLFGWFQTRRSLEVIPDPGFAKGGDNLNRKGLTWLANAPTTQNGQTTQSDTSGWSLNGKLAGTGGGDKPPTGTAEFGWSVNFSHTTSNTIADWKLLDRTDPQAGIWRFEAQQASPYAVDGASDAGCASMGNHLFKWDATHCRSLPRHVITDRIKDLSVNTAALQGLVVWDLGSLNNAKTTMALAVNTHSWYDAAGCARLTKGSKQGVLGQSAMDPKDLKSADCANNQSLPPNDGTWYERAQRSMSQTLHIHVDQLTIPKD